MHKIWTEILESFCATVPWIKPTKHLAKLSRALSVALFAIKRRKWCLFSWVFPVHEECTQAGNTFKPRQNGHHFAYDNFKCFFSSIHKITPIKLAKCREISSDLVGHFKRVWTANTNSKSSLAKAIFEQPNASINIMYAVVRPFAGTAMTTFFGPAYRWLTQWSYSSLVLGHRYMNKNWHPKVQVPEQLWRNSVGHIDGLVQKCNISSALTMEILQSCLKPSIYRIFWKGHVSNFKSNLNEVIVKANDVCKLP